MGLFTNEKENDAAAVDPFEPKENGSGSHDVQVGDVTDNADNLKRHLNNRQIQLTAIGGGIGTALFISIGTGLYNGGPGSLFIAYTLQSFVVGMINNCIAEMSTAHPVSGGFIRLAGHWVDDALGFMVGWNFFFYEALLIPFEVSAFTLVCSFWSDKLTETGPIAGVVAGVIICYGIINILVVRAYGEAEFWLSGGKVILIFSLFSFTFITMVGGNPTGHAYGFQYWKNPGSFMEYLDTGALGRFEGFLGALWSACFTVVGPEYISMVAAEAMRPRTYIKAAFRTMYYRFGIFFIIGSLAVGIVCSARDPTLTAVVLGKTSKPGAGSSPYVIAMNNLGVTVFPHIVNALILTSIFSAGNTYCYCSIRNLYGMALEGRAPKILSKTTRNGVPVYCWAVVMVFPCLSFLQCSNNSAIVITWFVDLVTAGGLINYIVISLTFIFYHRACKAQGFDRKSLPYYGMFQPYCAYFAFVWMIIVTACYGYPVYKPWAGAASFFQYYCMQLFIPPLFVIWKIVKRTRWLGPHEVDLVWERPTIDAYEESFIDPPVGFWREMGQLVGFRRRKGGNDRRRSVAA